VVVYKVGRLTRSLADFAKLVELFDQHQVSFVSVTQSFNTTSSMGRLRSTYCCPLHSSSAR
jgi:site-specific DNA recombinase